MGEQTEWIILNSELSVFFIWDTVIYFDLAGAMDGSSYANVYDVMIYKYY